MNIMLKTVAEMSDEFTALQSKNPQQFQMQRGQLGTRADQPGLQ